MYQFDPAYGVESPEFVRSLDGLGTEMVPGNRARLLENGDGIFPEMLAAIARAEKSVNLEIYIFDHGTIATRFAAALADRGSAGMQVRILVEGGG
ncbi:MAG: phospholipase D-like domain-containing protein [Syntrophomonadaceae bacterium]